MKRVTFDLYIDEVVECGGPVNIDNEVFKKEESAGKTFLFIDRLTNYMQAAYCIEPATDPTKYARVSFFPLSSNAVIVDEDVDVDMPSKIMEHIQDCCDKICKTVQAVVDEHDNHMAAFVGKEIDSFKNENCSGNGISEKTLLDALKIVTSHL